MRSQTFYGVMIGFMSTACWPNVALAQDNSESSDQSVVYDEIIVTANKREESLSKVGQTVSALSSEMLQDRRITDLTKNPLVSIRR